MKCQETKRCPKCGVTKPLKNFYKSHTRSDGLASYCQQCQKEYTHNYNRRVEVKAQQIEYRQQNKRAALELLGGCRCVLCDCTEFRKLTVDHLYRDGVRLRAAGIHRTGQGFHIQVLRMPADELCKLRVLCFSCNNFGRYYPDAEICRMQYARSKGLKWCPTCRTIKTRKDFHICAHNLDGLFNNCRSCAKQHKQQCIAKAA